MQDVISAKYDPGGVQQAEVKQEYDFGDTTFLRPKICLESLRPLPSFLYYSHFVDFLYTVIAITGRLLALYYLTVNKLSHTCCKYYYSSSSRMAK